MSAPDPARARFFLLQLIRMGGAAMALLGAAIIKRRLPAMPDGTTLPRDLGDIMLALGPFVALLVPVILARHWKKAGE